LKFIFDVAYHNGAEVIVSPGDLTDSPSISYAAYGEILDILKTWLHDQTTLLACFGQHDMKYRTMKNTALSAIEIAFSDCGNFKIIQENEELEINNVLFYGSSYGQEIPPAPKNDKFKVLAVHRMIIEEKLWSQQVEYEASNIFLRQHNYDLIVSGDNHRPFINTTKGGRTLINCGAMLRSNIDQLDHKPFVVLFDTETKKYERIFIPIAPGEDVFKMDEVSLTKERNENLEVFISGLSDNKSIDLTFEDNLRQYIKDNAVDPSISNIIFDSMKKEK